MHVRIHNSLWHTISITNIYFRDEFLGTREMRMGNGVGSTNKELLRVFRSPSIVRMEEGRSAFTILTGKLRGNMVSCIKGEMQAKGI